MDHTAKDLLESFRKAIESVIQESESLCDEEKRERLQLVSEAADSLNAKYHLNPEDNPKPTADEETKPSA